MSKRLRDLVAVFAISVTMWALIIYSIWGVFSAYWDATHRPALRNAGVQEAVAALKPPGAIR
jgi:hypothetical protein